MASVLIEVIKETYRIILVNARFTTLMLLFIMPYLLFITPFESLSNGGFLGNLIGWTYFTILVGTFYYAFFRHRDLPVMKWLMYMNPPQMDKIYRFYQFLGLTIFSVLLVRGLKTYMMNLSILAKLGCSTIILISYCLVVIKIENKITGPMIPRVLPAFPNLPVIPVGSTNKRKQTIEVREVIERKFRRVRHDY